ncbi:MAG: hypothetical protein OQK63_04895, partial [Ignavibacteriaceae bacterium]|nr:hypothetical protein [Ignavibacteriaceae bacterium]
LCIVSVLSSLKFQDQLYSHINGAFRAKASINEIQTVIESIHLLGNQNLSNFGLKVLMRFEEDKGMS